MKRLLSALLCLCLLLVSLTACGGNEHPVRNSAPEKETHLSAPVAVRPTPPTLLDKLVPLEGIQGVYELETDATMDIYYPSINEFCGQLLICAQMYNSDLDISMVELALMNIHTGAVMARASFEIQGYVVPQIRGEQIFLCDSIFGWVKCLDKNLDQVSHTDVEIFGSQWLVNGDGTSLYQMSFIDECTVVDLTTGESRPYEGDVYSLFSSDQNDAFAFLSFVGTEELLNCVGSLNYYTGEIEVAPFDGSVSSVTRWGDCWLGFRYDGAYSYYDGTQNHVIQPESEYDIILLEKTGHLLVRNYFSRHMMLYDGDGNFLSECSLNLGAECYPNDDLVWSEFYGGYFLTVTGPDGSPRLLFWQIEPGDGEALTFLDEEEFETVPGGTAVDPALYERAAQLSERFGVEILIADQCETEFSDYYTVQITNEDDITYALDILEKSLSAYPEGFIDQLSYGSIRRIQIHLTGALTGWNGHEMSSAGAFTQPAGEVYLMVMDIYQYQLEANFYHEFSHVIDHNMEWDVQYKDLLFSEEDWRALSPEDADYSYSYGYWPSTWDNGLDAWFVDDYSRTYPTEDRARVMEYAMMDWDWVFDEYHAAIRAKMDYYARCIRDCFNTDGWPEVCLWEEVLQEE